MAKSKYQSYETQVISRDQIKNADYNPRIMDDSAKKRLRKNLAKHGLVSALTWNKRTGNLVGGHQRLEQLDALEKSKDYELTVCVVDVDEREEAALNVQLNNPSMQGEWDLDKLAMMAEGFDLDLSEDMGFTQSDIDFMFEGDDRFSELFQTKEAADIGAQLEDIKAAKKAARERMEGKDSIDWYEVIVFENEQDRKAFLDRISIPHHERYITEEQLMRLLKNKKEKE